MNKVNKISAAFARGASKIKAKGQGMTEYLVILGLIAIAGIAVFSLFGTSLRNQVAGMAAEIAGDEGKAAQGKASTAAKDAGTVADKNYNMKTYVEGGNAGAK